MDKLEELRDWIGELNWEGVGDVLCDVVDKIDELNKPLVVPNDLGKWFSEQSLGAEGSFFTNIKKLNDIWVESNFEDFITDNKRELIEVILATRKYEVQKEKLYRVELPSGHIMYMSGREDKASYSYMPIKYAKTTPDFLFTEAEIKAIDKRYWTFAVEVANTSGE